MVLSEGGSVSDIEIDASLSSLVRDSYQSG